MAVTALFAGLGPPVGALLFVVPRIIVLMFDDPWWNWPLIAYAFAGLPFAYVPGTIPAAVCGMAAGLIWWLLPAKKWLRLPCIIASGAMISACWAILINRNIADQPDSIYESWTGFAAAGGGAALACALAADRLGLFSSNDPR